MPDTFSPHRRGQKFVPGGMADVVRGWVMDVGSSAGQGRAGRVVGRARGDAEFVLNVQVGDVTLADGLTLLRGLSANRSDLLQEKRLVLAGKARGGNVERVRRGDMVGVRAPSWEIEVKGTTWSVGVDWGAFDGGGGEAGRE